MSDKEREQAIFELGKSLVSLLGKEQAFADLEILYERHPEMFANEQEVKDVIQKVVSEPDLIVKNPTAQSESDYIAGKILDTKKMGEVGIRDDGDIGKIFHANKKRIKNMDLLAKKEIVVDGRDAHTPYTQAQGLDGRLVQKNISSTNTNILAKNEPTQEQISKIKEKASQIIKNGKGAESKKDFENER